MEGRCVPKRTERCETRKLSGPLEPLTSDDGTKQVTRRRTVQRPERVVHLLRHSTVTQCLTEVLLLDEQGRDLCCQQFRVFLCHTTDTQHGAAASARVLNTHTDTQPQTNTPTND